MLDPVQVQQGVPRQFVLDHQPRSLGSFAVHLPGLPTRRCLLPWKPRRRQLLGSRRAQLRLHTRQWECWLYRRKGPVHDGWLNHHHHSGKARSNRHESGRVGS